MKHKYKYNNFEYETERTYIVRFESGHTEEIEAKSSIDAKSKAYNLQDIYGFITNANQKK